MDKKVLYIIVGIVLLFQGFVLEVQCDLNPWLSITNQVPIILTGCTLVAVKGGFVRATPILATEDARECEESAECDVERYYCDLNIKRCSPCSRLCNKGKDSEVECHRHCLAYTLLLGKSKLTTANNTAAPFTTTIQVQTKTTERSNSSSVLLIVLIAILFIAFSIILIILVFVLLHKRCEKKKPQLSLSQVAHATVNNHVYSNDPTTQSQSKKVPEETVTLLTSKPPTSHCMDHYNKNDNTSEDSGIVTSAETDGKTASLNNQNCNDCKPGRSSHQSDPERRSQNHGSQSSIYEQQSRANSEPHGTKVLGSQDVGTSEPKSGNGEPSSKISSASKFDHTSQERRSNLEATKPLCEKNRSGLTDNKSSSDPNPVEKHGEDTKMLKDYEAEPSIYLSEPLPSLTKTEPKPYHQNKHIYDELRKIPWVEGYYSEGKSIQVYVDLLNLEPDWASRQLELETGQTKEKFHIIHSAQLT